MYYIEIPDNIKLKNREDGPLMVIMDGGKPAPMPDMVFIEWLCDKMDDPQYGSAATDLLMSDDIVKKAKKHTGSVLELNDKEYEHAKRAINKPSKPYMMDHGIGRQTTPFIRAFLNAKNEDPSEHKKLAGTSGE